MNVLHIAVLLRSGGLSDAANLRAGRGSVVHRHDTRCVKLATEAADGLSSISAASGQPNGPPADLSVIAVVDAH
jgi:hypothetical protein